MNWLKDNLLFLLLAATAVLGVALVIVILSNKATIAEKDAAYSSISTKFVTLQDADKTNRANLTDLNQKYTALVEQQRLDTVAAKAAADALEAAKRRAAGALADNQQLRAQLARRDQDVQDYLATGMPHELACQLWPDAADCKN